MCLDALEPRLGWRIFCDPFLRDIRIYGYNQRSSWLSRLTEFQCTQHHCGHVCQPMSHNVTHTMSLMSHNAFCLAFVDMFTERNASPLIDSLMIRDDHY